MWPLHLQLMRCGEGIRNDNIQSWLHNNQAPLTRIKYVPGENNCDFDELVESLRNRGSVSLRQSLPTHTHSYALR